MAGKKISELTGLGGNFADLDIFEISQETGGSFVSRKITGLQMRNSIPSAEDINDLTDALVENNSIWLGNDPSATTSTAQYNVAVGTTALDSITTGDKNISIGYNALTANTIGFENVAIGDSASAGATGTSYGVFVGCNAGGTGSGPYNVVIGHNTGYTMGTSATGNTLLGRAAGASINSGTYNTLLGFNAGDNLTTGDHNIILGYGVDASAVGVDNELRIGKGAVISIGADLATGAVTFNSAYTFPTADAGVAGYVLTSDAAGTVTWAAAGGGGATSLGGLSDCTTPATENYGIGTNAINSITTGGNNIGIGLNAGTALTTASDCVAIGTNALSSHSTTLGRVVAIGFAALQNSTNRMNVGIGYNAGLATNTGEKNVYIGYDAGAAVTSGSTNISIGTSTNLLNTGSNQICIGTNIATTAGDSFYMGKQNVGFLHGEYATAGQTKLGINLGIVWTIPTATLHVKGAGATSATTSLLVEDSGGNDILKITDDKRLVYTDGNEAAGHVLTSDANGIATWQAGGGGGASDLDGLTDCYVSGTNLFVGNDPSGTISSTLNHAVGITALAAITSGDRNTAFGNAALSANQTGANNTAVGGDALQLVTGSNNTAVGARTGRSIVAYSNNTFIGRGAGELATSSSSTCVGYMAGGAAMTNGVNTIIGTSAGDLVTSGQQNVFLGNDSGGTVTTGSRNTLLGYGTDAPSGSEDSIAIGRGMVTTANDTFVLGGYPNNMLLHGEFGTAAQTKLGINLGNTYQAPTATLHVKGQGATYATTSLLIEDSAGAQLMKLANAGDTILIGKDAGDSITGGSGLGNVAIGYHALYRETTGDNNIVIGTEALGGTSGANVASGTNNIVMGNSAMAEASGSPQDNIYLGHSAGWIGYGWRNVAIGRQAMYGGTNANYSFYDVAIGYMALKGVQKTGAAYEGANVALGSTAGRLVTGGLNNCLLGSGAGYNITTGSNNIMIGCATGGINSGGTPISGQVNATSATVDNELNIGNQIIGSMIAADRYTTFVGQAYSPTSTLTSSVAITPDFTNGNTFKLTLAHNTALANPTNPKDGATYTIIVTQDGTGSRTMSFGANYKWSGGSAPTLSTAAGAVDILTFISDGTNMYGTSNLNFS